MKFTRRALLAAPLAFGAARIEVIAHRGEHTGCPENTLPAIQKAIDLGCDWVEIDVRTTEDGHFVLMHNRTVEATTDGHGDVADLTLAQIKALDAGARKPKYRGTRVPTLDEALELLRGHCGVYFDAKAIPAPAIIAALTRHRLLDHCLVYGGWPLLKELTILGHPRLTMPEAVSVDVTRRILQELDPRVIAFDRRDFEAPIVTLARAAGKGVFVDRLGQDDSPEQWREAARRGATGIQTDHPAGLLALKLSTAAQ